MGHIIIEEGIVVGPNKIKSIMSWIIPNILTRVGALASLRLLSNTYSRILKGSLYYHASVQNKGTKFVWSKKREANFQ